MDVGRSEGINPVYGVSYVCSRGVVSIHMPHYQLTVEFDSVPSPSCPHLHLSPTVSTDKGSHPREPRHGGDSVGLGTVN